MENDLLKDEIEEEKKLRKAMKLEIEWLETELQREKRQVQIYQTEANLRNNVRMENFELRATIKKETEQRQAMQQKIDRLEADLIREKQSNIEKSQKIKAAEEQTTKILNEFS